MTEAEAIDTLRRDQVELLWSAESIRDDGDEPVVVPESSIDTVRDALGEPLRELGMPDEAIDAMSMEALAAAVTPDDDDETSPLLESLRQQPETGGESGEDLAEEIENDPEGIEALNAAEVDEVREKLETAARMESRTPRYAENLRQEAVDLVPGVDDIDEITSAIDGI